jgi:hypothetical protein
MSIKVCAGTASTSDSAAVPHHGLPIMFETLELGDVFVQLLPQFVLQLAGVKVDVMLAPDIRFHISNISPST